MGGNVALFLGKQLLAPHCFGERCCSTFLCQAILSARPVAERKHEEHETRSDLHRSHSGRCNFPLSKERILVTQPCWAVGDAPEDPQRKLRWWGWGARGGMGPCSSPLRAVCAAPWCPQRLAGKIEVNSEHGTREREPGRGEEEAAEAGRDARAAPKSSLGKGACVQTLPRRAAE